jgi:hypothetical protein
MGWMTRVQFPRGARDFSPLHGVQPRIQCVPGALSLGVNWQGYEVDHLPPYSVEVKNGGAIPPIPHIPSSYSA